MRTQTPMPVNDAYRLVVCGSRSWNHIDIVWQTLDRCLVAHPGLIIIHGKCPTGADAIADTWAVDHHIPVIRYKADWYGPCMSDCRHAYRLPGQVCVAAGPRRNRLMIAETGPDEMIAFVYTDPGMSKGTLGAVAIANELGVVVNKIEEARPLAQTPRA